MQTVASLPDTTWVDLYHRYVQPWRDDPRMKKTRVGNWIVFGFIMIGLCASGYIMYTGVSEAKEPEVSD